MPVSRPAVSQHLTVLRTAGLVSEHREGTRRIYRLEAAGIEELQRWVDALAADAQAGGAAPEPAPPAAGRSVGEPPAAGSRPEKKAVPPVGPKDAGGKKKHGKKRPGRK